MRNSFQRPTYALKRLPLLLLALLITWFLFRSDVIVKSRHTLIYHEEDLRRIIEWEILSGHWMSWRPLSSWFGPPRNPSLPSPVGYDDGDHPGGVTGCGWARKYIYPQDMIANNTNSNSTFTRFHPFPPRPIAGSIVDFDVISQRCDHVTGQYLRDCLEYLQVGGALNDGLAHVHPLVFKKTDEPEEEDAMIRPTFLIGSNRPPKRRPLPPPSEWRYLYMEDRWSTHAPMMEWSRYAGGKGLEKPLSLPTPVPPPGGIPAYTIGVGTVAVGKAPEMTREDAKKNFKWTPGQCDAEYPRRFHTYLEGELDETTYMTLLSFLYTQNVGLHLPSTNQTSIPCRPEFWVWVKDLGPDESQWKNKLLKSPFAHILLNGRFSHVIKFKNWNATEQMDATPEWSSEWRDAARLDRRPKKKKLMQKDEAEEPSFVFVGPTAGDQIHQVYNISMANTARWTIPHNHGGIFVERGVLFMRDWEEIWNYRGAFATRSAPHTYRNAVIKLNKHSALGKFVFRTALRHGLALDARSVGTYADDGGLIELLYPFPDMLADLAGWSHDNYQKKRPAVPLLSSSNEFFDHDPSHSPPSQLGLRNFFRGAWFYDSSPLLQNTHETNSTQSISTMEAKPLSESSWAAVHKRTYEAFLHGEIPNMYGESSR